jgi:hypothetical protein
MSKLEQAMRFLRILFLPRTETSVTPSMQEEALSETSVKTSMQENPLHETSVTTSMQEELLSETSPAPSMQQNPLQSKTTAPSMQESPLPETFSILSNRVESLFRASAIIFLLLSSMSSAFSQEVIGGIYYLYGTYIIDDEDDLKDLAVYVLGEGDYSVGTSETQPHTCEGMKFKMIQDISINYFSSWNEIENTTEDNFIPIGGYSTQNFYAPFCGEFDGGGHCLSGIRVYRQYNDMFDRCLGVFGAIGTGAVISNLVVSNSRFSGYENVGGIVGKCLNGTVTNCHVLSDVAVHGRISGSSQHGGIAGWTEGSKENGTQYYARIDGCSSAATLTKVNHIGVKFYGGIVGYVMQYSTVNGCLAIGATVPSVTESTYGAVAGFLSEKSSMTNNFYRNCSVAGSNASTGVGCNAADIATDNAAMPAYFISLGTNVTCDATSLTIPAHGTYPAQDYTISTSNALVTLSVSGTLSAGYTYPFYLDGHELPVNTFNMPAADVNVHTDLTNPKPIDWETINQGTQQDPYLIYNHDQLLLLAYRMKQMNDEPLQEDGYAGEYFKLAADIQFPCETSFSDYTQDESNFPGIGGNSPAVSSQAFLGDFNGDGHTISGLRIYSDASSNLADDLGLFGLIGDQAHIHHLKLSNCRITGKDNVGAFVGHSLNGSKVDHCEATNDVAVCAISSESQCHGGIVGYNEGEVAHCTSAVTLYAKTSQDLVGGIVGFNSSFSSIHDNLAIGVSIVTASYSASSALFCNVALSSGIYGNYYTACTYNQTDKPVSFGIINQDLPENEAAMPLLSDAFGLARLTSLLSGSKNLPISFGRTFTASVSSTICLPFDFKITHNEANGKLYVFDGIDTQTWTVTMLEASPDPQSNTYQAHIPYLFVPRTNGLVSFSGTIPYIESSFTPGTDIHGDWTFHGTYSIINYDSSMGALSGFASSAYSPDDQSYSVSPGDFVMAMDGASVPPFRCYMTCDAAQSVKSRRASSDLPSRIRVVLVGKDGTTTSLDDLRIADSALPVPADADDAWYTTDGRRLSARPSARGLYIHHGQKIVIR